METVVGLIVVAVVLGVIVYLSRNSKSPKIPGPKNGGGGSGNGEVEK